MGSARMSNPWSPSQHVREPAELMKPIKDPAWWYPADLEGTDAWVYRLSNSEVAEIHRAVADIESRRVELADITRENFPLPMLAPALAGIKEELQNGRGMALIRGLPVEGRTRFQVAAGYWGLGQYMGRAKSQNGRGHLLGHVMDLAGKNADVRGYMNANALEFHTDRTDILSLCCYRAAKSGGAHRIASSVTAYNEMLKRRPELVNELTFEFYRTRNGEIPVGETKPYIRQPIFSIQDGYFTGRSAGLKIDQAQALPGVPKLTPAQLEAMDLYLNIASEFSLDLDLQPGDITYVNCHVTLHARTDFEDWPEPDRKRHLFRLWLTTNGERPLVESVAREVNGGVVVLGMKLRTPMEPAEGLEA
jgi:TfdA family taurine catabolism dioxygenase TauD